MVKIFKKLFGLKPQPINGCEHLIIEAKDIISFARIIGVKISQEDAKEIYNILAKEASFKNKKKLYFTYKIKEYEPLEKKNIKIYESLERVSSKIQETIYDYINQVPESINNAIFCFMLSRSPDEY